MTVVFLQGALHPLELPAESGRILVEPLEKAVHHHEDSQADAVFVIGDARLLRSRDAGAVAEEHALGLGDESLLDFIGDDLRRVWEATGRRRLPPHPRERKTLPIR